ncbi:MAG: hypothetical protein GF347_01635 [Candidatus Moranbacteria bacterium]|nr:hypothetical protein [Candidatus Moranbacteria bacterium]
MRNLNINKFLLFVVIFEAFFIALTLFLIMDNKEQLTEIAQIEAEIKNHNQKIQNFEKYNQKYQEIFDKREIFSNLMLNKESLVFTLREIESAAAKNNVELKMSGQDEEEKEKKEDKINGDPEKSEHEKKQKKSRPGVALKLETKSDYENFLGFLKALTAIKKNGAITNFRLYEKEIDEFNFSEMTDEEIKAFIEESEQSPAEFKKIRSEIILEL